MNARYWTAVGAIAAAIPLNAVAEQVVTVRDTEVYAGPSSEFPSLGRLPENVPVDVAGCLSDWSWCDVTFSGDRGWVYAADIAALYDGRPVLIVESGPRVHLPVVTFAMDAYWDQHYRSKPFYGERQQWVSRVHFDGGHGGTPPAGHERSAQRPGEVQGGASAQSSTSTQMRQGQTQQQPQQGQAQSSTQRNEPATAGTGRASESATTRGPTSSQPDATRSEGSRTPSATGTTDSRSSAQTQAPQEPRSAQSPSPEQSLQREQRPYAGSSRGDVNSQQPSKSETGSKAGEQAPMRDERSAQGASKPESGPNAADQRSNGQAKGQDSDRPKREGEQ